uniref:VHS domain-containing protein n=1 Tax=Poecilia mexicana TaxID=48701 RepID=A0A3B3X1X8_9TELE
MEFLLGNPFSSPVGQLIERATNSSLPSEDWELNMEICDLTNSSEEGPRDAVRAIKKRIVANKNFKEIMLALTVKMDPSPSRMRSEPNALRVASLWISFLSCRLMTLRCP